MLTVHGSVTSPYVRRTRLLLADKEHDFKLVSIFDAEEKAELSKVNPTIKIPMLEDGDLVLFDTRVIHRYVVEKFGLESVTWEQENLLSIIDSISDSLVQLFILARSGVDTKQDAMYFNNQRDRFAKAFAALEVAAGEGQFTQWHYPSICLYCLVDWVMFRDLYDLSSFPNLLAFHEQYKDREDCMNTAPHD